MTKAYIAIVLTVCSVVWQDFMQIQGTVPMIQEYKLEECEKEAILSRRLVIDLPGRKEEVVKPWTILWRRQLSPLPPVEQREE